MLASIASATTFQAWTGDQCNGSAGSVVSVPRHGSCEKVDGRHSWAAAGDNLKGYYYSGSGCQGQSTQFYGRNGACNNINTGGPVRSMCVVGKSSSSSPSKSRNQKGQA